MREIEDTCRGTLCRAPRAPQDKKIHRTNAKHHDRAVTQAIQEVTPSEARQILQHSQCVDVRR
jgi:hypothetical protein